MTNKGLFIAGTIAVAIVVAGGVALMQGVPGHEPPRSTWAMVSEGPPHAYRAFPRLADAAPRGDPSRRAIAGGASRGAVTAAPSAAASTHTAPQEIPIERRAALRVARREMIAGFSALREQVTRCRAQDASFVLALEASGGTVRVESARVESQGSAPDEAVACARSALSGQVFSSPNTPPGKRWEVPFSVPSS